MQGDTVSCLSCTTIYWLLSSSAKWCATRSVPAKRKLSVCGETLICMIQCLFCCALETSLNSILETICQVLSSVWTMES